MTALPDGSFTVTNLPQATYYVYYNNKPLGYTMVYPQNGPPPTFQVTVGTSCSVDGTTGAFCGTGANAGSVFSLYYAITNSVPWLQSYGADLRVDSGVTDTIPATAAPACGAAYASVTGGAALSPGVVITGDSSADFGSGQASTNNWLVGGLSYPEVLPPGQPLKTAYQSLLNAAAKAGLPQTPPSSVAGCLTPSVSRWVRA